MLLDESSQRALGIVCEPDIIATVEAYGANSLRRNLRQALQAPRPLCSPDDFVSDALARMTRQRIRYLIVVNDGDMIGLVSIGDLVKARLESAELETKVLRDMARSRIVAGA